MWLVPRSGAADSTEHCVPKVASRPAMSSMAHGPIPSRYRLSESREEYEFFYDLGVPALIMADSVIS